MIKRDSFISKNVEPALYRPVSKSAWKCWDAGAYAITKFVQTALPAIVKAHVAKRVSKNADGYLVRGDDMTAVLKSYDSAVRLVEKAVLAEVGDTLKSIRAAMAKAVPDDQVEMDDDRKKVADRIDAMLNSMAPTGTTAALDNSGNDNAAGVPIGSGGEPFRDTKKIRERIARAQKNVRLR